MTPLEFQKMMTEHHIKFAEFMLGVSKNLTSLNKELKKQNELLKPLVSRDFQEMKTLVTLGKVSEMYQQGRSKGKEGRALFNNIKRKAGRA